MLSLALKRALGVLLVILGLIAFAVPVVPGAVLLFIGIELLGITFLLPMPIRSRWENFKMLLWDRWHRWHSTRKRRLFGRCNWML